VVLAAASAWAQINLPINPAPNRRLGEGEGPFERLVIRGATVIDGTGAQPRGPIDIWTAKASDILEKVKRALVRC